MISLHCTAPPMNNEINGLYEPEMQNAGQQKITFPIKCQKQVLHLTSPPLFRVSRRQNQPLRLVSKLSLNCVKLRCSTTHSRVRYKAASTIFLRIPITSGNPHFYRRWNFFLGLLHTKIIFHAPLHFELLEATQ